MYIYVYIYVSFYLSIFMYTQYIYIYNIVNALFCNPKTHVWSSFTWSYLPNVSYSMAQLLMIYLF